MAGDWEAFAVEFGFIQTVQNTKNDVSQWQALNNDKTFIIPFSDTVKKFRARRGEEESETSSRHQTQTTSFGSDLCSPAFHL